MVELTRAMPWPFHHQLRGRPPEDGEIDKDAIKNAPAEPVEPEIIDEPEAEAEADKPSGSLRAALASMREDTPAEATAE